MEDPDKIKALYNTVSKDYDVGGYDDFATKLQDSAKRKSFYDFASKKYDLGDYTSFESNVSLKKKDSGLPSGTSVSPTASKSSAEPKYEFGKGSLVGTPATSIQMPGEKTDQATHEDDPINEALKGHRSDYTKALNEFNNSGITQRQSSESTGQKVKPQQMMIGGERTYGETVKNKLNGSVNKINDTFDAVSNHLFPDVDNAKEYLKQKSDKNNGELPKGNETVNVALKKVDDYNSKEKNILSNFNLVDAAVNEARKNIPSLDKQLTQLKEGNVGSFDYNTAVPPAMLGRIVDNYLNDKTVQDVVKHNPDLKEQFDDLKSNILTKYPEYGANVVANELSRAREKEGKNNAVANFAFGHSDYMDKLAEKLYKNDPQKLKIYNDVIKDNINDYIDTPGFFDRAVGAIKHGFEGTKRSINELTGTRNSDLVAEDLKRQGEEVNSNPTSAAHQISSIAGDMSGTLAYIVAGTKGLGAAGVPANVADKVMIANTFFGDEMANARKNFTDPSKQKVSAGLNTLAYMFAGNAIPSAKLTKVLAEVRPEFATITDELASGKISADVAKTRATHVFEQGLKFAKAAGKQELTGTGEMVALTGFKTAVDKMLGLGDKEMQEAHPNGEIPDVIKTNLIGMGLPSLVLAARGIKAKSYLKDGLYSMAENPKRFQSVLHDQMLTDPDAHANIENKLTDLDHLAKTKAELDRHTDLTVDQKKQYIYHDYNEKKLTEQAEGITNDFLRKKVENQIEKSKAIKENIFKGKGTDVLPQEDHLTAKEYKEVSDIKNDQELFDYFVKKGTKGYASTLKAAAEHENPSEGMKMGLEYMEDKAVENPKKFREDFGDALTEKMLDRVSIDKLHDSFKNLYRINEDDPSIPILEKLLDEREAKGEVLKPSEDKEPTTEEPDEHIQPTKESQISVIKPGEIAKPEIIPLKTKDNATTEQSTATVDVRQPSGDGEKVGGGNTEPPISTGKEEGSKSSGEEDLTRLTHADTEKIYQESGLPLRLETPVKHFEQLKQEAQAKLEKGYDYNSVAEKVMDGKYSFEDSDQLLFARRVADLKAKQKEMSVTSPEFDAAQNEIEKLSRASDVSGTITGRSLQARKNFLPTEESISDELIQKKETLGVDVLTDKQKEETAKLFNDEQKATSEYEKKIEELQAENTKLKAEAEIKKSANNSPKKKREASDIKKEREDLKQSILDKWKKASNDGTLTAVPIPFAKQLSAIAPDVAKLMKSYVEEGLTKLEDVVKAIHKDLKDVIDGISEKDIHNIIAGEYNEKKPTRKQLAIDIYNLKTEATLINKLEKLESGEEPKSEKKKIERNQQISDLRKQIKEHDLTKLSDYKNRVQSEINKVEEQIKKGDFSKEEPKESLKFDKEAIELQDKLIEARNKRALSKLRDYYNSQSKYEKGMRYAAEILNIPRAIMSSTDLSAVLRQGVIPAASHPIMAAKASAEMLKSAVSQKSYDRWFFDLQKMPRYKDMMETRLGITDSTNPNLQAREELFMSNLAEKVPLIGESLKIGGKTVIPGLGLIKGSERAYSMFLNKMRVDLYNRFADAMEQRGLTLENSPKQYKAMADYVNNSTGRGSVSKDIEPVIPLLNSVFFSPRLIASRINMLTYLAQPRFYKTVPPEVRKAYFKDMASFVGIGLTVLALAKLNGAEVEDDPRSSDFGKIKSGNTRWDIWGGFQPYARTAAQVLTGERKSTNTGKMYELNGEGAFGQSRGNVMANFFRGKLAPIPGLATDMLSGRDMVGNKIVYQWNRDKGNDKERSISDILKTNLLPMTATGMEEALKDQGTKAWFTVGVPSIFGVGTQVYETDKKKKK